MITADGLAKCYGIIPGCRLAGLAAPSASP
jgi:hypothetical protein